MKTQKWRDKLAAGFTVSGAPNSDDKLTGELLGKRVARFVLRL